MKTAFLLLLLGGPLAVSAQHETKAVPVIYDSGMGSDYDDVGALAVLHALADRGRAQILATIASHRCEGVAPLLNCFNTYYHRPGLPIGMPRGAAGDRDRCQRWAEQILTRYPHQVTSNDQAQDAVALYRKTLDGQPDHSVTIITAGTLGNLAGLLRSQPDTLSPLDGATLVRRKVKLLVSMAGSYPQGREANIYRDAEASRTALVNWPTPVILSGFEIGSRIRTGLPLVRNRAIKNNPVKDVFARNIPATGTDDGGRMSWDETTVWVAIMGYRPYFSLRQGHILIAPDGSDSWDNGGQGQFYLVQREPSKKIERILNKLIMEAP